jgi:hypothetical protein
MWKKRFFHSPNNALTAVQKLFPVSHVTLLHMQYGRAAREMT